MRRRQKEVGGSLDSLLDTMTNVVGILIILLIVTQLNVGEKVKEIRDNLPDISPEQIVDAKAELDQQKKKLDDLKKALKDPKEAPKVDPKELEALQKQLAQLQKQMAQPMKEVKLGAVKKEDLDKNKKKLDELKTKIEAELKKMESLTAQLANVPLPLPGPPSKVVKMPDPRAAPKGAKAIKLLCTNGKVYPIDIERLQKSFASVFKIVRFKKNDTEQYLKEPVVDYFSDKVKGDSYFNIRMDHLKYTYNASYFKLEAKESRGFSAEQLKKGRSSLESRLRDAARENKASMKKDKHEKWYVRFVVEGDSFEAYLAAREIAEKNNLAVGWQPTGWNGYTLEKHGLKLAFADLIKPKPTPSSGKKPTGKKPSDQID